MLETETICTVAGLTGLALVPVVWILGIVWEVARRGYSPSPRQLMRPRPRLQTLPMGQQLATDWQQCAEQLAAHIKMGKQR